MSNSDGSPTSTSATADLKSLPPRDTADFARPEIVSDIGG